MPLLGLLARDKDLINTSRKDIRTARTKLSGYKSDLNKLLFKYYKNDRRLHDPVVNTIGTLEQDSINCIEQSPYQMKMVIRGIRRSLKDPDEKDVRDEVFTLLRSCFRRIFSSWLKEKNIDVIMEHLEGTRGPLYQKIDSLTEDVMGEADGAPLNESQERIRN